MSAADRRGRKRRRKGSFVFVPARAGARRMSIVPAVRPMRQRLPKEKGYVDVASATYKFDTTGSIVLLNTIAQGAGIQQRVGKRARMTSLQIRGYAANDTTATTNDCAMLIVYDKRPTGALPNITDILDTANSRSFNNDDNSSRFKIVRRLDFQLRGNVNAAANYLDSMSKNIDEFSKLRNLPVVYKSAGTGAIGDIEQGALYLVTVGNTAAGTAAANLIVGFRLRFVDQ